ncbi:MAG: hypothetical protein OHK0047_19120 [Leptolyngbyaceae cyanobacterium]
MIISDIAYTEEVTEACDLEGGRSRQNSSFPMLFQSLLQSLAIYPASSASNINLGGTSIGNTAISMNITMPILIAINGSGASLFGYSGRNRLLMPFSFW